MPKVKITAYVKAYLVGIADMSKEEIDQLSKTPSSFSDWLNRRQKDGKPVSFSFSDSGEMELAFLDDTETDEPYYER